MNLREQKLIEERKKTCLKKNIENKTIESHLFSDEIPKLEVNEISTHFLYQYAASFVFVLSICTTNTLQK